MTARTITIVVLCSVAAGLIGWDVYAAYQPVGSTISEVIRFYAARHLIIPVGIGVLIGHWFWAAPAPRDSK